MRRGFELAQKPLRIPHPKIGKLACQAQGVGIFAEGEISLHDAQYIFSVWDFSKTPIYYTTHFFKMEYLNEKNL